MDKLNPINAQWPNFPEQGRYLDQRPFYASNDYISIRWINCGQSEKKMNKAYRISAFRQFRRTFHCSLTQADNVSNSLILRFHPL